jgi:MFS family permease
MTMRRDSLRRLTVDTQPLAVPAFRRLVLGHGISWIGYQITTVTVLIQVFDITGSSLWVGSVGLSSLVPMVVFGLYGGAVSDAMDRRRILMSAAVVVWTGTAGLVVQAVAGLDRAWLMLMLTSLQAVGFAFANPTRGAVIPRLLPRAMVPAGNTLISTVGRFGSVLGPLIAGVAVTQVGYAAAYAIDLGLYLSMMYAAYRLPSIPPLVHGTTAGLRSIGEGLAFIRSQPVLLSSFAIDIMAMVFAMPRALFPEIAAARFGDSGRASWLFAALAVGSVLAGLGSGWVGQVGRPGRVLVFAVLTWGTAIAGAGLASALWATCAFLAVGGASDLVSSVFRQTILQTYAPDEMRGRMQGAFVVVVVGGPALGDIRAGSTASAFGATGSWVGGAVVSLSLVALMTLLRPSLYRYRADDGQDLRPRTQMQTQTPASGYDG